MIFWRKIKNLNGLMIVKRCLMNWRNNSLRNQSWWCQTKKTIPDRSRCFKICYKSGPYPIGFKWWQTSHFLYLKDPLTNWKELLNLWSRITGNNPSIRGMVTLYTRIPPPNSCLLWPQESYLLLRGKEAKSTTSKMVTISIWIWCEAGTFAWR